MVASRYLPRALRVLGGRIFPSMRVPDFNMVSDFNRHTA